MDRRIQKTRKAILSAFEELLSEKRYEQITVQNLIDRADIGRSTFYAHFETKDDLLKYTCQELFAHVFDGHPDSEVSHDFSGEKDTVESMLTHILYHLRDDRSRYTRIFSCESADLFWRYFQSQFETLIGRYGTRDTAARKKVPEDFYLDYYCSSYIESVKWWFRTGLKAAPEELTGFFMRVTG
ncbi:MAG: TetR/AcrR family transcriptional regulator C-terminal domain-containing protein [Lachnospiraceae bacterium]|nr:TetR family transcriptional regulator [Sarcina sp.]MBQ6590681.1 TetR/AcrR family transcriptional regulator C-terminal domain-containing protein [Lachnospiraceae bacterium]